MRILVVDAFTDRPFGGNPAGVCLLDGPADPAWMQRVAAEMRHSETAFPRPIDSPDADFELRWFTPEVEVALCGHATLATAHALYDTGTVPPERPIRFQTLRSGVLTVRRADGDGLEMDFPAVPATAIDPPADLAKGLGATPVWTGRSSQHDILAVVDDAETVRKLRPDFEVLASIDARGICVTATEAPPYDFVSRFFAPTVGIPEDPVTGSAHCMLGPYWAARLGREDMTAYQASDRGGVVGVVVHGDRVTLTGRAVTVLDGTLRA
ncbi:MAG TPA: PhzF family phenazine biosynthesis protein [Streptosporangiaceae bacterium]|nr:PhzF family phenazine biosynthesis protein [Streptosporangiaceae bacterium]